MLDKNMWVGYIKTGKTNTLVLRDDRLDTGNPKTLFLYDSERDQIVEYNREIIEPKLVEGVPSSFDAEQLVEAYLKTLRKTRPNTYNILFSPKRPVPVPRAAKKEDFEADIDEDLDDDELADSMEGEDWDDDEDMDEEDVA